MRKRPMCAAVVGQERIGGASDEWDDVICLLPPGHDGPHADWTAWLGVRNADFSSPGASKDTVAASSSVAGPDPKEQ